MRQTGLRRQLEDTEGTGSKVALGRTGRRLITALVSVAAGLVAINVVYFVVRFGLGHESVRVPQFFNLNNEENLPASLSGSMLAIVALLSLAIGLLRRRRRASESVLWFVLAAGLFYFCIDELTQIHEQLSEPMRDTFGLTGIFYFAWVVPAIVVLAALLPIAVKFTRRLEPQVRSLFILATILYVGGAIGVEMVGGYIAESRGFNDPWYVAAATIEESAEIAGILVLMYALLIKLQIETTAGSHAPTTPAATP
ncbi:MAG: hypothetical protein GY722_10325 [bacterium]|nr:hypothetical protein [bacterium]